MTTTSRLFSLCTTCQWKEVVDYLHQNGTNEAKKMLHTGKRGAARISALQAVLAHPKCKGKVPLSLINILLQAAPEMALQNHLYTGNFPLHAVFYNAFFSSTKRRIIAEMIIKACPSTILLKNAEGRTALHTNCSQHCNYEPIVTLLKAAPQIVTWRDNHGDLPLHLACKSLKSPNKSIQVIFDLYPQGMFVRNTQGHTPLEATIASGLPHAKLVPRVNFIKDLEALATKRVFPSSSSSVVNLLGGMSDFIFSLQTHEFYRGVQYNNALTMMKVKNSMPHHNYSQSDTNSSMTYIQRKRIMECDSHSIKVKRQAMDTASDTGANNNIMSTWGTLHHSSQYYTTTNPNRTKQNTSIITTSPTSTKTDFFHNEVKTETREDFSTAVKNNEIMSRQSCCFSSYNHNTYGCHDDADAATTDMEHIKNMASILSMMRNNKCEHV